MSSREHSPVLDLSLLPCKPPESPFKLSSAVPGKSLSLWSLWGGLDTRFRSQLQLSYGEVLASHQQPEHGFVQLALTL